MFAFDDDGSLSIDWRVWKYVGQMTWSVRPLAEGSVYEVVSTGSESATNRVQIFPRLLCTCQDNDDGLNVCGHLATALFATRSPLVNREEAKGQSTRATKLPAPGEDFARRIESAREIVLSGDATKVVCDQDGCTVLDAFMSPAADLGLWLAGIRIHQSCLQIRNLLALVPEAVASPEIVVDNLRLGGNRSTVARILMHSSEDQFPEIFRGLARIEPGWAGLTFLANEQCWDRATLLSPNDLKPFFHSGFSEVRNGAREVLARIGLRHKQHTGKAPTPPQP